MLSSFTGDKLKKDFEEPNDKRRCLSRWRKKMSVEQFRKDMIKATLAAEARAAARRGHGVGNYGNNNNSNGSSNSSSKITIRPTPRSIPEAPMSPPPPWRKKRRIDAAEQSPYELEHDASGVLVHTKAEPANDVEFSPVAGVELASPQCMKSDPYM